MRIVIIDDEKYAIEELKYYLEKYELSVINTYNSPQKAIKNLYNDNPEIIFLDIDMPGINGIELALKIQSIFPSIIFVFVTAYANYALDAYKVHPMDYILKPIDPLLFNKSMQYIVQQYQLINKKIDNIESDKVIHEMKINCFGKLTLFKSHGEMVKFPTKKSKELFAYLLCNIDKPIYRDEIISQVFGFTDTLKAQNNFYVSLHRLRTTLNSLDSLHKYIDLKENIYLTLENGVCEYVDLLKFLSINMIIDERNILHAERLIANYNGEFLTDIDNTWINEYREWLVVRIEDLMTKMSLYYNKTMDMKKEESILNKIIEINPYNTFAYEQLLLNLKKSHNIAAYQNIKRKSEKFINGEF